MREECGLTRDAHLRTSDLGLLTIDLKQKSLPKEGSCQFCPEMSPDQNPRLPLEGVKCKVNEYPGNVTGTE